jgi:hypothetical protein
MLLAGNLISHFIWLSRVNEMHKAGLHLKGGGGGERPGRTPRRLHKTEIYNTDIIKIFTSLK